MRRCIVALALCGLLMGLGAGTAMAAESGGKAAPALISIDVRDASVPEVIHQVMKDAGANVVVDGDVTGAITLCQENVPVERVLEYIYQAKGYYWWRDQEGTYFVSTRPRPAAGADVSAAPAAKVDEKGKLIAKMHRVQFFDPQYLCYLFGTSDDPGPMPYAAPSDFAAGGPPLPLSAKGGGVGSPVKISEMAGMMGGGGRGGIGGAGVGGGAGTLAAFLPEDITDIVAVPILNGLIVRGSEQAVDELIDFIKMLDRKPQQIIVELQSVLVSTELEKEFGINWYYAIGNTTIEPIGMATSASLRIGYTNHSNFQATLTYLLRSGHGRVTDAIRISTMNLLPAYNAVVVAYPVIQVGGVAGGGLGGGGVQTVSLTYVPIQTYLQILPQILGDGTINMVVPYVKSTQTGSVPVPLADYGTYDAPIWTVNSLLTTVNVRDGETFVVGGFVGGIADESELRIPILGDIPLLGDLLFTRRAKTLTESETLLFITPRIVKEEAAPVTLGPI